MQVLKFITDQGVCGFIQEWNSEGADFDAPGWLEKFGRRIGSGTAPLPNGNGWIDLSKFSTVIDQSY